MATTDRNTIDLNADLGEGEAGDADLLRIVSSCNIACGGHAGDADSIAATIGAALAIGVAIGAHPSYPDREGFGRRSHYMAGDDLHAALWAQALEFTGIAADLGARARHVKPHGALYNDAAVDARLADVVARVTAELPGRVALVGPGSSELELAARRCGIRFIAEAFADRRYRDDRTLVPRSAPGALITDLAASVAQALALARAEPIETDTGRRITVAAGTLCIHGDTPGATHTAAAIREALERCGIRIAAPACGDD